MTCAAHQRLAAHHLAGQQFFNELAAQARLGIDPGVFTHALNQQGVGERGDDRVGHRGVLHPHHQHTGQRAVAFQLDDLRAADAGFLERAEQRCGPVATGGLDGLLKLVLTGVGDAGSTQDVEVLVEDGHGGLQQFGRRLGDAGHTAARDERLAEHPARVALAGLARKGLGDGGQHVAPRAVVGNDDDRHLGRTGDGGTRDGGHHSGGHALADTCGRHQQSAIGRGCRRVVEHQGAHHDAFGTAFGHQHGTVERRQGQHVCEGTASDSLSDGTA